MVEHPLDSSNPLNLPPGWYAVFESSEVSQKRPQSAQRFGIHLVFWRNRSGQVIILEDHCPHRGAQLSLGKVVGDNIQCPFHGFQFDSEGKCQFVPELNKASPGLCVKKFKTLEKYGLIWLNWRDQENQQNEIPWFPQQPDKLFTHSYSEVWKVHFSRSVENQLDFAHLPFVHKTSIGRFSKIGKIPKGEITKEGLRYYLGDPQGHSIQFLFPNIWLNYLNRKFMLSLAFAPIDANSTKLYLQVHRGYFTWPPFSWIMNFADRALKPPKIQ